MSTPNKCQMRNCKNKPTKLVYCEVTGLYYYVCESCPKDDSTCVVVKRLEK